jgi:hypothetical protein
MAVIINDFEIITPPMAAATETQPPPNAQNPAPPAPLRPEEIERIVRQQRQRQERIRAT